MARSSHRSTSGHPDFLPERVTLKAAPAILFCSWMPDYGHPPVSCDICELFSPLSVMCFLPDTRHGLPPDSQLPAWTPLRYYANIPTQRPHTGRIAPSQQTYAPSPPFIPILSWVPLPLKSRRGVSAASSQALCPANMEAPTRAWPPGPRLVQLFPWPSLLHL